MQLDDFTIKRSYMKVTCTKTVDKQDQDFFRVDQDICKMPAKEVEYQFFMNNICLK